MSTLDRYLADAADAALAATRSHADAPERARRQVLRVLDAALQRIDARDRGPVACRAGCALCCHLRVVATAAEVFGLLDHLRAQLPADAFAAFAARVQATAERVHALPATQRLAVNLPCPVLVDGRCSGYAARPLNCRAYHSLDLAACEAAFAEPQHDRGHPQYAAVARVNVGVQRGFAAGLGERGLDTRGYELVTALAEALRDAAARTRFAAGERAFVEALTL